MDSMDSPLLDDAAVRRWHLVVRAVWIFTGVAVSLSTPLATLATALMVYDDRSPSQGRGPVPAGVILAEEVSIEELSGQIRPMVRGAGEFLTVVPIVMATLKLGPSGFAKIARSAEFPSPDLIGKLAFFSNLFGSILVLFSPLFPGELTVGTHQWTFRGLGSMTGCCMLIAFLFIATWFGHVKKLETDAANKVYHSQSMVKNLGLIGGLVVIMSTSAVLGDLPFRQDVFGRFLTLLPFLGSAVSLGCGGFREVASQNGMPAPAFFGLMAYLLTGVGSLMVLTGAFVHGYIVGPWSWSEAITAVGAGMLMVFLCFATIVGHCRKLHTPQREQQMNGIVKNIGLVGCLLVIASVGLPTPDYTYMI